MASYWLAMSVLLVSSIAYAEDEDPLGLAWSKSESQQCQAYINSQEVIKDRFAPVECKNPATTYITPRPNGPPTQDELEKY